MITIKNIKRQYFLHRTIFDGVLEELVSRYAKEKIIKVYLSKEDDIKRIETIGKVKRLAFPQVILSVPRSTVAIAAAELLQNFPIEDLTIEEPPIEEIIRKVFKGETRPKNVSK